MVGAVQAIEQVLIKESGIKKVSRRGVDPEHAAKFDKLFDQLQLGLPEHTRPVRIQWPKQRLEAERQGGTVIGREATVNFPFIGLRVPTRRGHWDGVNDFYSVVIADVDFPTRKDRKEFAFLHYASVNIKTRGETKHSHGKNRMISFTKGNVAAHYVPIKIKPRTGKHRIIVMIFKQQARLEEFYLTDDVTLDLKEFQPGLKAENLAPREKFIPDHFMDVNDMEFFAAQYFTAIYETKEKVEARVKKRAEEWKQLEEKRRKQVKEHNERVAEMKKSKESVRVVPVQMSDSEEERREFRRQNTEKAKKARAFRANENHGKKCCAIM